jgi:hypothetical protein
MKTLDDTNSPIIKSDEEPRWTPISSIEETQKDEELLAAFLGNPFLMPQQHYEPTTEQNSYIACTDVKTPDSPMVSMFSGNETLDLQSMNHPIPPIMSSLSSYTSTREFFEIQDARTQQLKERLKAIQSRTSMDSMNNNRSGIMKWDNGQELSKEFLRQDFVRNLNFSPRESMTMSDVSMGSRSSTVQRVIDVFQTSPRKTDEEYEMHLERCTLGTSSSMSSRDPSAPV